MFQSTVIRTEGALLPPELLEMVATGEGGLEGLKASDYHLLKKNARLHEEAARAFTVMRDYWEGFKSALEKLPEGRTATSETRERLLLPLFEQLGYGRLPYSKEAPELDEKVYEIRHAWTHVPFMLLGWHIPLDKRSDQFRSAPHAQLQEFLNRSDDHLWAILSNGRQLRLLRDNISLSRQAYVEFDLEAIFEEQRLADFQLLWLLCHQSRLEEREGKGPEGCWLETWSRGARQRGVAALDKMRQGVEDAIEALGVGLIEHPANVELRRRLESGELDKTRFFHQVLRTVYRMLFLFTAEERGALLDETQPESVRSNYDRFYSLARLRRLARRVRGSRHGDLWQGLGLLFRILAGEGNGDPLGLKPLGSFLWSGEATPDVDSASMANSHLLEAIRKLAYTEDKGVLRPIDFANLGAEELGSVYESLLELHPEIQWKPAAFELTSAAGNQRKTTGSYYTPTSLIDCLLDSALEPVIERALGDADPEQALLDLKICDPACGSGHFLVAAAHRLAHRLASVRSGDEEPAPPEVRKALRDVVGRCIYGVDINPMSVELCKVSLWMQAIEPGKPLGFLDHHIQCGNSLIGATPALIEKGVPDDAFKPITGDDRSACTEWKKQNKAERKRAESGQMALFAVEPEDRLELQDLGQRRQELEAEDADSLEGVKQVEQSYLELLESDAYRHAKLVADAWCAAFVLPKTEETKEMVTHATLQLIRTEPGKVSSALVDAVHSVAGQYKFLHWHLAYPEVFQPSEEVEEGCGWRGGFDVVLGNPPWERIKIQEKEWFAERDPDIANAPNAAARGRMIKALIENNPTLYADFQKDLRKAEGDSSLLRNSGLYPLCGRGDVNTYTVFSELNRNLFGQTGRAGFIVPSGIATDDTTKFYFQDIVDGGNLASLYDFENRKGIFPGVHKSYKFCLVTLTGSGARAQQADFVYFALGVEDLDEQDRHFNLSAEDISLINPNTRTCPIFRTQRDAEITKAVYRRVPVLIDENNEGDGNPWGIRFKRLFDMANDSGLFRTRSELEQQGWRLDGNHFVKDKERYVPLYEAKMVHHFNHRWATYTNDTDSRDFTDEELIDPKALPMPRYWVPQAEVDDRLDGVWDREWLLGWRDICRSTDVRTTIAGVIPRVGAGDKFLLMLPTQGDPWCLFAEQTSYTHDYIVRQKLGSTSFKYFSKKQIPNLSPSIYSAKCDWASTMTISSWLVLRVLELTTTAHDLTSFAADLGYTGPPFRWDESRRLQIRCELDAAFFHLYGIEGDDVDYIMETFPIVKRKDIQKFGDYRTKLMILRIYDQMAECIANNTEWQSPLNPPPGDPRAAHPE